jgi:alkanesulfonate monooxygenase SsuD/methylene tetrahydromethanopterin reductase-like flavin-dependent oxidoreductase (luciferase family)
MKVTIMQEGHRPDGVSIHQRFREMVDEAILADELGFDTYGQGEQHFARFVACVPTPEISSAYIAARTKNIRFRAMSHNLLPFNHPIRIAEQIAALDVLSGGRAEFGAARSNNPYTLETFGIPATATKGSRDEQLRIIGQALASETFEFHGEHYDIPERSLAPKPVQQPHPPLHLSATSPASHGDAGRMGIGVMCGNTSAGWEYAEECVTTYRKAIAEAEPITGHVYDHLAMLSTGVNVAWDEAEAKEVAKPVAFKWMESIMGIYTNLSKQSPDYAYLGKIEKLRDRMYDIDYLVDCSPYITIGTPEFFIERARQINDLGADEWLLRLDGMGHENNLKAIRLLGEEILPEVHKMQRTTAGTPAA